MAGDENVIVATWLTIYLAAGVLAWAGALESGVHTTIVGVIAGLLTPTIAAHRSADWLDLMRQRLFAFEEHVDRPGHDHREARVEAVLGMSDLSREAVSPLDRLEHEIHPWVAFLVVPAFALANAGVELGGGTLSDAAGSSLTSSPRWFR